MISMPEKRICILIIDDDESDRILLERNLRKQNPNFEIVTKTNPIEAAFFFKKKVPDVILADVNYEGYDNSALEALIKLAERYQIPVVVHSGAEWQKPIQARGIYFRKKGDTSPEYYKELAAFLIDVYKKHAKVEIATDELHHLSRPEWHTSNSRQKVELLMHSPRVTKEEREVLWLRLELLRAYDDLKIDKLQGLPQYIIDSRLDYALSLAKRLEEKNKKIRVSLTRKQLDRRKELHELANKPKLRFEITKFRFILILFLHYPLHLMFLLQ